MSNKLNLRELDRASDVITISEYNVLSSPMGPCVQMNLELPAYHRGVYYRAFLKYPERPITHEDWVNGANRLQSVEFNASTGLSHLSDGGMMLTLELMDGRYMTILPLMGLATEAWLGLEGDSMYVRIGSLGTSTSVLTGELPLISYSISDSIYVTSFEAWKLGISHPLVGATTKLRSDKSFPHMFEYIGWCSWEEFFFTINEEKLLEVIDQIDSSSVPIKYFLIDDGHQVHDESDKLDEPELASASFNGMQESRLINFNTNKRFPNGWAPVIARIKNSSMNWAGLWLNFNGYWGGIHPVNEFGMDDSFTALLDVERDHSYLLPREGYEHSYRFYNKYIETQCEAGFDFLKIDHQAANLAKYRKGGAENPVICAANNSRAMEAASAQHMDTHINCMAHNAVAIFNTTNSSVTRCSEDYIKGNLLWAKRHVHNSFATMPVLGHTVWGDHDMFHSNDPTAAQIMSICKALSGGPVYLSDTPEHFNLEVIFPLIYSDGKLLRPLAPAVPLPDSILEDPVTSTLAYGAIAPLINHTAAIALFNLTEPNQPVSRTISLDDYKWAGSMLQPPEQWEVSEEGMVLYNWKSGEASLLTEPVSFTLDSFDSHLLQLSPIHEGWSVIGRSDKYLSAAAAKITSSTAHELVISIEEPGTFLIWSRYGTLTSSSGTLSNQQGELWKLVIDATDQGTQTVRIYRKE